MQNQKGQIQIVFLLLVVIGLILFNVFTKEPTESGTTKPSEPILKEKTVISAPAKESSPAPSAESAQTAATDTPPITVPDTTPPERFNTQPTGNLPPETRRVALSLETDEKATCRYMTASGFYYEYMQYTFSNTNATSHSTLITTLSEGEEYTYYVRCVDEEGNANMDDFEISFKVSFPEDTTPPDRRGLEPAGVLPAGTTAATISLWTDEPAYCRYSTEQVGSYRAMRNSFARNKEKTYHTAAIKGLEDGKSYSFFVRCKDLEGNKNTGDVAIHFSVGVQP